MQYVRRIVNDIKFTAKVLLRWYAMKNITYDSFVKPPLASIQTKTKLGTESVTSSTTLVVDHAKIFKNWSYNSPVLRDSCNCLSTTSQTCSIGKRFGHLANHCSTSYTRKHC